MYKYNVRDDISHVFCWFTITDDVDAKISILQHLVLWISGAFHMITSINGSRNQNSRIYTMYHMHIQFLKLKNICYALQMFNDHTLNRLHIMWILQVSFLRLAISILEISECNRSVIQKP